MSSAFIEKLLEPLPAHEVPADSKAYRMHLAVIYNLERYGAILQARPNYRPDREDKLTLKTPACHHGCAKCYMECAIAPERLKWWKAEMEKLEGILTAGRS